MNNQSELYLAESWPPFVGETICSLSLYTGVIGLQIFFISFFDLLSRYIYTHSYQKAYQIIEKSVTEMKPFEFASCPRKPHLSSSMRLEGI